MKLEQQHIEFIKQHTSDYILSKVDGNEIKYLDRWGDSIVIDIEKNTIWIYCDDIAFTIAHMMKCEQDKELDDEVKEVMKNHLLECFFKEQK